MAATEAGLAERQMRQSRLATHGAEAYRPMTAIGSRLPLGRRDVVYQVFARLAQQVGESDSFWAGLFRTMSHGRLPRNVVINDDRLMFTARRGCVALPLSEEIISDWNRVADFFREHCNYMSDNDWERKRASGAAVAILNTPQINRQRRKARTHALPKFILTMKERFSLSASEMDDLSALLTDYYVAGKYRQEDVICNQNGGIIEIKTLTFNEVSRTFDIKQMKSRRRSGSRGAAPRGSSVSKEIYVPALAYLMRPLHTHVPDKYFEDFLKKRLKAAYTTRTAHGVVDKKEKPVSKRRITKRKLDEVPSAAASCEPGTLSAPPLLPPSDEE